MITVHNYDAETDYDLDWEFHFQIKGKRFVAKVPDGRASAAYKSAQLTGSVFRQKTSEVQVGQIGTVENVLVGYSCWNYSVELEKVTTRVGPAIVEEWPSPVIKDLFEKVKEKGGLNEAEDENDVDVLKKQVSDLQEKIASFEDDKTGNSSPETMYG